MQSSIHTSIGVIFKYSITYVCISAILRKRVETRIKQTLLTLAGLFGSKFVELSTFFTLFGKSLQTFAARDLFNCKINYKRHFLLTEHTGQVPLVTCFSVTGIWIKHIQFKW